MRVFLIDGYNLMHAAGLAGGKRVGRWDKARTKFLDWLADAEPVRLGHARIRVVFDAQNGNGDSGERTHRGVWVRYALRQTADDLIEFLLANERSAEQLTVVSNDGRVQEAARRRGSHRWGCEAFMDWLVTGVPGPGAHAPMTAMPPEKPDVPTSPEEYAEFLDVFRGPPVKRR